MSSCGDWALGASCHCMDPDHERRMGVLLREDGTNPGDTERLCLFYIIAGSDGLYSKRDSIYNFEEHVIRNGVVNGGEDFPSSLKALVRLGFNLYNGYRDKATSPLELFWNLDGRNRQIARNAIQIRFDIET